MRNALVSWSLSVIALPRSAFSLSFPRPVLENFVSPRTQRQWTVSLSSSSQSSSDTHMATIPGPDLPPIEPTSKRLFLVRHGEVINPGALSKRGFPVSKIK